MQRYIFHIHGNGSGSPNNTNYEATVAAFILTSITFLLSHFGYLEYDITIQNNRFARNETK